jgi:hypothetical protein
MLPSLCHLPRHGKPRFQFFHSGYPGLNLSSRLTALPVAFHFCELSRLLFKCAIIQAPLLLAFTLTAGLAAAALAGFPLFAGIVFGLKCGLLLFASRFISVALTFSAGTNDTSSFKFRALLLIFLMVGFGLGFIGLGGVGLFLPNALTAWMFCLGAAMDAYAFFWIYQWFYNSGRFDLMSLPRR